jgi:tetratricopeptide (TPR) repeat protein
MSERKTGKAHMTRALSFLFGLGLLFSASPVLAQSSTGSAPALTAKSDEELLRWLRYISKLEERSTNDPTDYNLYLRLADAYGRLGLDHKEKVLFYTTRAVLAGADDTRVDIILGDFYSRVGDHTGALRAYLRVVAQAPQHTYTLLQLRRLAVQKESFSADVDLAHVREILLSAGLYTPKTLPSKADATAAKVAVEEGYGYIKANENGDALARFQAALDLDPNNATAVRGMGIVYARTKKTRQALAAYAAYLDLDPGAQDAASVRATIASYYESR